MSSGTENQNNPASTPYSAHSRGFDFGSPECCMLKNSFDFLESLGKADVSACAYGEYHSDELGMTLPVVSLVGTNENALIDAFREFERWGGEDDGDVVDLRFILLDDGGYLLSIGPEPERMSCRLRGYDRVLIALHYGGTWLKKFDSRHQALESLAERNKALLSPFFFYAAAHPQVADPADFHPHLVRPIEGIDPLLKFDAYFIHERNVFEESPEWGLLNVYRSDGDSTTDRSNGDVQTPPKEILGDSESFRERRKEMLSRHFAVLLHRFRNAPTYTKSLEQFSVLGVRPWQIDQAVCNLDLSQSVCGCPHYTTLEDDSFKDQVIPALASRFELADSQYDESTFSSDAIRQQIALDSMALLCHFSIEPQGDDVETLAAQLHSEGLLDA